MLSHRHLDGSFPTCEMRQDGRHYFNFIDEKIGPQSSDGLCIISIVAKCLESLSLDSNVFLL